MTDNTDSINTTTAGAKSDEVVCAISEFTSGRCIFVNQRRIIKEKFEKYYEYYQTVKDKALTYVRESTGKQSIAVKDETKKASDVTSSK